MLTTLVNNSIIRLPAFFKNPCYSVRDENGDFKLIQIMLPAALCIPGSEPEIGRMKCIFFTTDFDKNIPEDRIVSHQFTEVTSKPP
jgi:hypothetical protein